MENNTNIEIKRNNNLKEGDKAFGVTPKQEDGSNVENLKASKSEKHESENLENGENVKIEDSENTNAEIVENINISETAETENLNAQSGNYDARNFEFGADGSVSPNVIPQKEKSFFGNIKDNLKYVLSYTPALIYTGLTSLFCLLMMLFFISRRNASLGSASIMENHPEVITSYSILMYAFVVFLIIAGTLFVSSIILNTIRCKQGKK